MSQVDRTKWTTRSGEQRHLFGFTQKVFRVEGAGFRVQGCRGALDRPRVSRGWLRPTAGGATRPKTMLVLLATRWGSKVSFPPYLEGCVAKFTARKAPIYTM